jgi:hypothetical protein
MAAASESREPLIVEAFGGGAAGSRNVTALDALNSASTGTALMAQAGDPLPPRRPTLEGPRRRPFRLSGPRRLPLASAGS